MTKSQCSTFLPHANAGDYNIGNTSVSNPLVNLYFGLEFKEKYNYSLVTESPSNLKILHSGELIKQEANIGLVSYKPKFLVISVDVYLRNSCTD